jgi:hypothetical protein
MTLRSYDHLNPSNLYDGAADLDYVEKQLVQILYSLGYDESALDSITVDELIGAIREQHPYVRPNEGTPILPASSLLLKERNIKMVMTARRLWHKRTLAKATI